MTSSSHLERAIAFDLAVQSSNWFHFDHPDNPSRQFALMTPWRIPAAAVPPDDVHFARDLDGFTDRYVMPMIDELFRHPSSASEMPDVASWRRTLYDGVEAFLELTQAEEWVLIRCAAVDRKAIAEKP